MGNLADPLLSGWDGRQDEQACKNRFINKIDAEHYVEFRLDNLIDRFDWRCRLLSSRQKTMYVYIFTATAMSSLLTLLSLESWVGVVVVIATSLHASQDFTNV